MKKLFIYLAILAALITALFGLASCGQTVEFNVNFIVDGETYSTVGTGGEEVIAIPENPTKEGYTFDGWYWDKDTWQTPFTANSLLDAPLSSDMNVYAKWKENEPPLPDLQGAEIRSKALTLTEDTLKVTLSNVTETFSFLNDITVADGASYVVARDIGCEQTVASKTVSLEAGDNVYYILVTNGNEQKLYTATVRRHPMYTVSFNTNGGTAVASQTVEEGSLATPPTTTREGYTFASWNYDFSQPVTSSVTVSASWNANTNTPYKVEYYLENLDKNGYDKVETLNLTGTTDTTATAEIRTYEHFTYYSYRSNVSGNIDGNGTRVLRVYYMRNTYTVTTSISNNTVGSITAGGTYPYGKSVTINVTHSPVYNLVSFSVNGIPITNTTSYTFTVSANTTVSATLELDIVAAEQALEPFTYTTTTTTYTITGIKDKTVKNIVVPDFVTNINEGAFSGCSSLESITLPFIGASKDGTSNTHFGYIFGASSDSYNNDYVPESLKTVIITGGTSIDEWAFSACDSLTSVTIPNSVTSIGDLAFSDCTNLTSITIPNSVTSIGSSAFYGCKILTSVTIPNSVTSIGSYAFWYCTNLTSVTIGNGVTSIDEWAFRFCTSLTSIKYRGTQAQWNSINKGIGWNSYTGSYTITFNYTGE